MKKFYKMLFALVFVFSLFLAGCGNDQPEEKGKLIAVCVGNNDKEDVEVEIKDALNYTLPTPEKEGYEFVGWFGDEEFIDEFTLDGINVGLLKQDIKVYAYAKWKICNYTVSFVADGKVLKSSKITYGKPAVAPTAPELNGKTFVKWDKEFNFVKSDMTITAIYEARPLSIKYVNMFDGSEITNLGLDEYKAGENVDLPIPELDGFEFAGWYLSPISLYRIYKIDDTFENDLVIYGRFNETKQHSVFTIPEATYRATAINKVPNGSGTFVYQPVLPAQAGGLMDYDWSTSDETIATCSQYSTIFVRGAGLCVVTGTHKTKANVTVNYAIKVTAAGPEYITEEQANNFVTHKVTFKDKDGNEIDTQTIVDGATAIYPQAPIVEGFSFIGWDKECYNIKVDTVITAQYKAGGENKYQGKTFAFIGDSISTFKNYIPDGFSCFYPYATGDTNDVNQTWWMQTVNKLGGQLFVNNSYSGSCVVGNGSSAAETDGRLAYTKIYNQTPDVIVIYMGSNDAHAKYETFAASYRTMLTKLKALCPNSEIVLLELLHSNLYTDETKDSYNASINSLALEFDCKVIKSGTETLVPYLIDSAHPYTAGMTMIANKIVSELTK